MQVTEQVEILQRQLAESQARALHLETLLVQRGTTTVGQFLDGLKGVINAAQQGNPQAKANLQELVHYLDLARSLAGKIVPASVVPNGKV